MGGAGEQRFFLDITVCGELKKFVFEHIDLFDGASIWLGWNSEQSAFLRGMQMTELIGRKLAHELKNPLQPIQIVTETWMETEPRFAEDGQLILTQIERMQGILAQFKKFSDSTPLQLAPLHLAQLLGGLILEMQKTSPTSIKWSLCPMGTIPEILGDASRLTQVFANLLKNAAEAIPPEGGMVQVGISLDTRHCKVAVEISDSGVGVSPEFLNRLFSPFFTTKSGGTGLGLVVSRQIIHLHGGELSFSSQEHLGTTVTVLLPMVRAQQGKSA